VAETSRQWLVRFIHVARSPNTLHGEARFEAILRAAADRGRVLDLGCGEGESSSKLHAMGAAHVLGIDVSETEIEKAREREIGGELEFRAADASQGLDGTFDLIYGRSILHHLDYRPLLRRLYAENLAPGGTMAFMEPLGTNLLTRAFHAAVRSAHTPDERPLRKDELRWFADEFEGFELIPVNYVSYPAALASSLVLRDPDNPVTRLADRVDRALEARLPRLHPHFRQGILVVTKP
jgi:SAM-dependent methyltransferase